jgi:uncharacterized membrane protein YfcA
MDIAASSSWTTPSDLVFPDGVQWFLIVLVGAGVGYLGGLFGKGGSAIATPFLALIGIPPIVAIAAPLPATIPGTLVAFARYRRQGFGDPRVIRWSIACGVPATIVGAIVTRWIGGSVLVTITDAVVAALGLRIVLQRPGRRIEPRFDPGMDGAESVSPTDPGRVATVVRPTQGVAVAPSTLRLVVVALVVGFLAGMLANSGGFLLVPLYLSVLKLPIKQSLACSLAVAAMLAIPGTLVHAALGHIDWTVAAVFGAASIPLSSLGARQALRMDATRLEHIYGAGLAILGIGLLAFT